MHGLPNTAPTGSASLCRATRAACHGSQRAVSLQRYADSYLDFARRFTHTPFEAGGHFALGPRASCIRRKAFRLSRAEFIDDLLREHESEIRRCLRKGAHNVQIDFTEGRLAMKIDPGRAACTASST